MRPLLIGYGNALRGDDGLGPVVAQRVAEVVPEGKVEVRVVHQLTPELAELLARTELVIFTDAAMELRPGEVRVVSLDLEGTIAPEQSHSVDPHWLLHVAATLYGQTPRAFAVLVGPADFDLRETLSPAGERGAAEAVDRILALLGFTSVIGGGA